MTERTHPPVEEEALATGWSLVDEDGDLESISSDDSSTMDFVLDSSMLPLREETIRTVPVADYRDLVMVDILNENVVPTSALNLESDEDIVRIVDDATDDNLDDWVTHELDRRRANQDLNIQRDEFMTEDDDGSSECSAASSDHSSWVTESVPNVDTIENEGNTDTEELPPDYPRGYCPSGRAYTHRRNNDANKCLTISLLLALIIVSGIAFGHFRGTTVVTRHSHFGAAFESASPAAATADPLPSPHVLSDIQKDQTEIFKQLQQMLNTQVELKQRIISLEDENKDLRMRLLESRKKCTRILHRSSGYYEPPVVSSNASDNEEQKTVVAEDSADQLNEPKLEFPSAPLGKDLNAVHSHSLSGVIRAQQAASAVLRVQQAGTLVRANIRPIYADTRQTEKVKPGYPELSDYILRMPKDQSDFATIEDRVVGHLIESATFKPVIGERRDPISDSSVGPGKIDTEFAGAEDKPAFDSATSWTTGLDGKFVYSDRSSEDLLEMPIVRPVLLPSPLPEAITVPIAQDFLDEDVTFEVIDTPSVSSADQRFPSTSDVDLSTYHSKVQEIKADLQREQDRIESRRKIIRSTVAWKNYSSKYPSKKTRIHGDNIDQKQQYEANVKNIKDDIRRERERIDTERQTVRYSGFWKNSSKRGGTRQIPPHHREKRHPKTKFSSTGLCKNGQSVDGYCFLKPNKYRKPEKPDCDRHFWTTVPNFLKNQFDRNGRLERAFRGLGDNILGSKVFRKLVDDVPKHFEGLKSDIMQSKVFQRVAEEVPKQFHGLKTDIVQSKVYQKVMEEVPKHFKVSSEWLDCQWRWWQSLGQTGTHPSSCEDYLSGWQHKQPANADATVTDGSAEESTEPKEGTEKASDGKVSSDAKNSSSSNWFFKRASDRAQFRKQLITAGRRMGNLTSWLFQRAKDRELHRMRHLEDSDYADSDKYNRHGYGLPVDPIYEFLRHRAAWRRSFH